MSIHQPSSQVNSLNHVLTIPCLTQIVDLKQRNEKPGWCVVDLFTLPFPCGIVRVCTSFVNISKSVEFFHGKIWTSLVKNVGIDIPPPPQMYYMFDKLLLLAKGKTAYFGPVRQAMSFFSSVGLHCDLQYNPADYMSESITSSLHHNDVMFYWWSGLPCSGSGNQWRQSEDFDWRRSKARN